MKFVAIDFETANAADESICAAGIAVFEDGRLAESKYWLIRPPKGFGSFRPDWVSDVHGIPHTAVYGKPEFPAIAPELFARLAAADIVIAHNAPFDMRKLRGTTKHFGLPCPEFDYLCTLALSRRVWPDLGGYSLDVVAAHIGHELVHHHALADAEAAGVILLAMMKVKRATGPRALAEMVGVRPVAIGSGWHPLPAR